MTLSTKEQALADKANAAASAKGADKELQTARAAVRSKQGAAKPSPVAKVVDPAAAHGATDKAPHTKRAVQQAKGAPKVHDIAGNFVPDDKRNPALIVGGVQYGSTTRAKEARKLAEAAAKAPAKPAKVAKAKTAKAAPATKADRAYKVVNKEHGARPDSKRALQLAIVFAHTSVNAAKAAGAEGPDFALAEGRGFIKYTT